MTTHSNCPLYICYAILRGLANRVVATKSPAWFLVQHYCTLKLEWVDVSKLEPWQTRDEWGDVK